MYLNKTRHENGRNAFQSKVAWFDIELLYTSISYLEKQVYCASN